MIRSKHVDWMVGKWERLSRAIDVLEVTPVGGGSVRPVDIRCWSDVEVFLQAIRGNALDVCHEMGRI